MEDSSSFMGGGRLEELLERLAKIRKPEDIKDIKFSEAEKIILNDLMIYFLNSDSKSLLEGNISKNKIYKYADIFCKTLNSVYEKDKSFQLVKIINSGKYFALHFGYVSGKINPKFEKENQESTHIQKVTKVYSLDSIIITKPKQFKYWLPSIALMDADETFADYIKARYYND